MTLTPEQFNLLATKEDLKEELQQFATKSEMKESFDAVLDVLDGIVKKLDTIEQELTSNIAAHDRMDEKICDHESRIAKLEFKAA